MTKSHLLTINDLTNPTHLIKSLSNIRDLFSEYVKSKFSNETLEILDRYNNSNVLEENLVPSILEELNRHIEDTEFLRNLKGCVQIFWSEKAEELLNKKKSNEEIYTLNRYVFEGAYPKAFLGENKNLSNLNAHVDKIIFTPSFQLGPRMTYSIMNDPKHILFVLARYKFSSKILQGKSAVLELGCGDAFGSPLVGQVVNSLTCIDIEPILIEDNIKRFNPIKERFNSLRNIEFQYMNMINNIPNKKFDAIYSIDVWEHIEPELESIIMENICKILNPNGIILIGTPNIEADKYSSEPGASPHVNLKNHNTLRELLDKYFENSFIFSMNDEVVHTGFYPMAHYLFGLGVNLKI